MRGRSLPEACTAAEMPAHLRQGHSCCADSSHSCTDVDGAGKLLLVDKTEAAVIRRGLLAHAGQIICTRVSAHSGMQSQAAMQALPCGCMV